MQRAEPVIAGVALAVMAFGVALAILLPPPFTRAMSTRYSELPASQAVVLAESARRLVVTGDPEARSALGAVMTTEAVEHLDDVGAVIGAATVLTLALLVALGIWIGLAVRRRRFAALSAAFWIGAGVVTVLVVAVALLALTDFDTFFSGFHAIFFAPGTWVFPSDSLLIELFPEPFWVASAVAWAGLICFVALLYGAIAWWTGALSRGGSARATVDR